MKKNNSISFFFLLMEHPSLLTYEDGAVFTPSLAVGDPISLSPDAF
jgi:hypothetical protein